MCPPKIIMQGIYYSIVDYSHYEMIKGFVDNKYPKQRFLLE
jgi:hypothetical protein